MSISDDKSSSSFSSSSSSFSSSFSPPLSILFSFILTDYFYYNPHYCCCLTLYNITLQKVVNSLDIRFGPIIEELKDIDLLLGGRLPENFNDSQASQLQEAVYKLTGRRDFFLSIPYSDTDMENKEQGEDQEDQLKPKPSLPNLVSSKYLWATALGMFCLIVGFQPIFADLCLKSKFNEATVVLLEAALSALVGLVLVCK